MRMCFWYLYSVYQTSSVTRYMLLAEIQMPILPPLGDKKCMDKDICIHANQIFFWPMDLKLKVLSNLHVIWETADSILSNTENETESQQLTCSWVAYD